MTAAASFPSHEPSLLAPCVPPPPLQPGAASLPPCWVESVHGGRSAVVSDGHTRLTSLAAICQTVSWICAASVESTFSARRCKRGLGPLLLSDIIADQVTHAPVVPLVLALILADLYNITSVKRTFQGSRRLARRPRPPGVTIWSSACAGVTSQCSTCSTTWLWSALSVYTVRPSTSMNGRQGSASVVCSVHSACKAG